MNTELDNTTVNILVTPYAKATGKVTAKPSTKATTLKPVKPNGTITGTAKPVKTKHKSHDGGASVLNLAIVLLIIVLFGLVVLHFVKRRG